MGASASASGSASVSHPVKQGLVQVLSVFLDTIVICTATALLCMCSGVEPTAEMAGMGYVQSCISNVFGQAGVIFITVALVLFAFTTLLGNFYYVDNLIIYIMKKVPSKTFMTAFRVLGAVVIFIGAGLSMGLVWDIADVLMGIMAIINIPVIIILGKPALAALEDYAKQKKAGKNPVFKAETVGLKGKTEYWQ